MRNSDNEDFYREDSVMHLDNSDAKAEAIGKSNKCKGCAHEEAGSTPGFWRSPKEDEGEDF